MLVRIGAGRKAGGRSGSELEKLPSLRECIEQMWAVARYSLHLSTEEFYALTPRQFHLLVEAHHKRLAHQEMIQAYTTAAVINYSLAAPEQGVKPTDFMPHYRRPEADAKTASAPKFTADELQDWQTRVMNLAAELKQGHGPMLDEIKAKADA